MKKENSGDRLNNLNIFSLNRVSSNENFETVPSSSFTETTASSKRLLMVSNFLRDTDSLYSLAMSLLLMCLVLWVHHPCLDLDNDFAQVLVKVV